MRAFCSRGQKLSPKGARSKLSDSNSLFSEAAFGEDDHGNWHESCGITFRLAVAAALCGALTLVAVISWALLLLRDSRLASFAAGLTLFNNFLFVMSRVGMMDSFLWSS